MQDASLLSKLAEHGITGLLLAIALYAIFYLYRARDSDAKAYQAQLLELTKTAIAAVTNSNLALAGQKEMITELRDAFREWERGRVRR